MNFLRRRIGQDPDGESDGGDSSDQTAGNSKSRKPPNTAFRQQRLKAWQPLLTPKSVIPFLFLLALIFAPLGIAIIHSTYKVELITIDYTQCGSQSANDYKQIPNKYTSYHFNGDRTDPKFTWKVENSTDDFDDLKQTCHIQFHVPKTIKGPIYLYYKLTNFFQNHRKYVQSYDLEQLRGAAVDAKSVTQECEPLRLSDDKKKVIYPCGLIADSYFNDTISNPVLLNARGGQNNETYELTQKNIAWSTDRKYRFRRTKYKPDQIVPPPNWYKSFPQGYNESNIPDLSSYELLQNWMRSAGLPSFYKLYGKNTTASLQSGQYELTIEMNYPVSLFAGTKSIVLTTNSIFGGRNLSLGVIYVIVAILSLVLGIAFLFRHLLHPRTIGDHKFLQNTSTNVIPTDNSGLTTAYRSQL